MTTLYQNLVDEHFQYELGKIRDLVKVGKKNLVIDNSYIGSFLRHRVGLESRPWRILFYNALMEDVFPSITSGTLSFPLQTDIEHDVLVRSVRKDAKLMRAWEGTEEEIALARTTAERMECLGIFMRILPSEALIDPSLEKYRSPIRQALDEIALRPGVMKETRVLSKEITAFQEHKENDVKIMTSALLIGLSDSDNPTYVLTRDSDLRAIGGELGRKDDLGLEALANKYGFPFPRGFDEHVRVVYHYPRGKNTLDKIKMLAGAHKDHLEFERARAARHHHLTDVAKLAK